MEREVTKFPLEPAFYEPFLHGSLNFFLTEEANAVTFALKQALRNSADPAKGHGNHDGGYLPLRLSANEMHFRVAVEGVVSWSTDLQELADILNDYLKELDPLLSCKECSSKTSGDLGVKRAELLSAYEDFRELTESRGELDFMIHRHSSAIFSSIFKDFSTIDYGYAYLSVVFISIIHREKTRKALLDFLLSREKLLKSHSEVTVAEYIAAARRLEGLYPEKEFTVTDELEDELWLTGVWRDRTAPFRRKG